MTHKRSAPANGTREEVHIPAGPFLLEGLLDIPAGCSSIVLFAHGSGSSRLSRRNQFVAKEFSIRGIGTVLFDLLTAEEDLSYENRFNIDLLTTRLLHAVVWLRRQPGLAKVPVGLFGASTGAAAALKAAARSPEIRAVVSRGGRPDLAGEELGLVQCPTLLIVGGHDYDVIEMNRTALEKLNCTKELAIVPGATHLFEEPGTLEDVAVLAVEWFEKYL